MPHASEPTVKTLSDEDIQSFRRDGVICVRQLYSPEWVATLTEALDVIVSTPSPITGPRRPGTKFHADVFTCMTNDQVLDFVLAGPGAHVAQQVFGSRKVNFFYDQIFVKEQLTPEPTPWHHDFTFWPLAGDQIASLWTSVDAVTPESSALEFIAGSHLWPQRYKAVGTGGIVLSSEPLLDLPDIEADRSKYNILSWDLQPGDALLFHALTLHGARGNRSPDTKRRAIATRWCGDDVTYAPRGRQMPLPYDHGLKPGDPLSGPVFFQVLPHTVPSELARRMRGPVVPTLEALQEIGKQMATAERVPVAAG